MKEYILEANNLSFAYPGCVKALDNLSVKVEKGTKTVFLGENGAGKSTLFLHFNGVLTPKEGELYFKNEKMKYDTKSLMNLRKSVGIVFQDPETQLFSANVAQEVSFGPINLGFPKKDVELCVDFALNTLGIKHLSDKPTHFLSYGQKKRVTIASIIAMGPEVIIFDEPTNYLDPKHKDQIMEFLDELNKKGTTIILSTHDINIAYSWADVIVVMKDGKVLREGTPENIFNEDELIEQASLKKPVILEIYNELKKNGHLDALSKQPKSKNELFELLKVKTP